MRHLAAALALATACTHAAPPAVAPEYDPPYTGTYRLVVEPHRALADEPIRVTLDGLRAAQRVTLRAQVVDGAGVAWASEVLFRANAEGRVDTAEHAPIAGSYSGVDPGGLLWSMRAVGAEPGSDPRFSTEGLARAIVAVSALADGRELAHAETERVYPWAPGALARETLDGRLHGTLWHPRGGHDLPAILIIGGSGATPQTKRAALLAARGYAVLDLQYFGQEGLPRWLVEIPLEYFAGGLDWLRAHGAIDPARIGVFGSSKGAEAALLLGTLDPEIRALSAYLPSFVVWQGLSLNVFDQGSSWALEGEPLAYVPLRLSAGALWRTAKVLVGRPVAVRSSYAEGLQNLAAVRAATIPVERTRGAILLVSGTDDQVWPSTEMSEMVVARLDEQHFPYPYRHLAFEGAGHGLGIPGFPRSRSPVSSWSGDAGRLLHGGSAAADERASAGGWAATIDLFRVHLQERPRS